MIFKTTPEQIKHIEKIEDTLLSELYDVRFVTKACELARTDQGVYDLLDMWYEACVTCREIIKDIDASLKDYGL